MDKVDKAWLKSYPAGVPAQIDVGACPSLVTLLEESFERHAERIACIYRGRAFSYRHIDEASRALAAWLQGQGLQHGDRVALMLLNTPQYPIAVAAVLRAGGVIVNINPLHAPRELEHQLRNSGARALILLENFAHIFQQVTHGLPVKTVLLTSLGEWLPFPKGWGLDTLLRHVRKSVPDFDLPDSLRLKDAVRQGERMVLQPARPDPGDIAALQYTGGTTGVSKAAVLLHRNLVANVLQCEAWYQPALRRLPAGDPFTLVCALPLHQLFGFTTNLLLGMRLGACNVLVPHPHDLPALFKALTGVQCHGLSAVNTLYDALMQHPDFAQVDWSHLRLSLAAGPAVPQAIARRWLAKTGCPICEGYGLSEASPAVSCNPTDTHGFNGLNSSSGNIGLPLPGTEVQLLDDSGRRLPPGNPGEIAVRGPQVMAGYWQRPDETAQVMAPDGFLRTGDIGQMDERGYLRIFDRKKDTIQVSGFNVYPNEVEELLTQMPGVAECAVVGVRDERSGAAVKAVIVPRDAQLSEEEVRAYCEQNLTGYKRPKVIEFRCALPKSALGRVLRRELRATS